MLPKAQMLQIHALRDFMNRFLRVDIFVLLTSMFFESLCSWGMVFLHV